MKKSIIVAGFLVWALWQMPAAVWAEDTRTDQTKELERRIDVLSEEVDELKESGGVDGLSDRVKVHGYGELHFNMPTDGRDSTFDQHRFVLGVEVRLADWIFLNAEIDFEHAAQAMEFEFGYLDFLIDPAYNVRGGVMLAPIGFLNEYHEPPLFWTVERPDFHKSIIPTTWNVSGAGFFGTPMDGVNYRVYVTNALQSIRPHDYSDGHGAGGNKGFFRGKDGIRGGRLQPDEAIFEDIAVMGRLELTKLLPGLQAGFSFHTGNTTQNLISEGGFTALLEADIKYRYRWFDMNASIAHINVSDAGAINTYQNAQNALGDTSQSGDVASDIFGWNIQAGIHMPQLLNMSTSQDVIPFILYEFIDTQNKMPVGFAGNPANRKKITTLGISYLPVPVVAVKFDYQHISKGDGNREDQVNMGLAYMF
jgi:hypothetical protein